MIIVSVPFITMQCVSALTLNVWCLMFIMMNESQTLEYLLTAADVSGTTSSSTQLVLVVW